MSEKTGLPVVSRFAHFPKERTSIARNGRAIGCDWPVLLGDHAQLSGDHWLRDGSPGDMRLSA